MKKEVNRIAILVPAILIVGLLVSACGVFSAKKEATQTGPVPTVTSDTGLISEGHLVPRDFKYLSFVTGGIVAEIPVKIGDQVASGQVLASLGNREQAQAALASANLELTSAQQAVDELNRNVNLVRATDWEALIDAKKADITANRTWDDVNTKEFQRKIDDAQTEANNKKDALKIAQDDFDKYKNLSSDNSTRQSYQDRLDTAQQNYDEAVRKHDELVNQRERAKADLDKSRALEVEAQRKFDAVQTGPDPDQLALALARLTNAKDQVSATQAALDNLDLKSPFAGTVVDINVVPNEEVGPTAWAVLVADFSEWYVETDDLTELKVVKTAEGQAVKIVPDALPDVTLAGKVVEISKIFGEKGGDITYKARILVNNGPDEPKVDPRLRWGMTMEVGF